MPTHLAHAVFFTLRDPGPENRRRLIEACHEHLSGHPGTVSFSVGARTPDLEREVNDRDFDVALHIVFDSREAHDTYQPHERHLRFIEENQTLWRAVRIFDADLDVGS